MIKNIFMKTFAGLNKTVFIRHFIFGLVIAIFFYSSVQGNASPKIWFIVIINTFLYPYSRFIYEQVINYICGENVFFVNIILLSIVKFFTIVLCWSLSIFIAPVGLIFLYFYNTKQEKNINN